MDLGMIGLGRMGGNMVQRLISGGHRVVTYDRDPEAVTASHGFGGEGACSLEDVVARLAAPLQRLHCRGRGPRGRPAGR